MKSITHAVTGIPYAKPPVGERRLTKPEPYGEFEDLNATEFGPACPQVAGFSGSNVIIGKEDCLMLNVYVPDAPANELRVRTKLLRITILHLCTIIRYPSTTTLPTYHISISPYYT